MSRQCDEIIDVRVAREVIRSMPGPRSIGALEGDVPDRFVWRGRFYLVHEVVSSWRERQAWWKHPVLAQKHAAAGDLDEDMLKGTILTVLADGADRRVWRVRASAGSSAPTGVYDLAEDPLSCGDHRTVGGGTDDGRHDRSPGSGAWRLIRISD